ncbi:UNKNOWN [Stylonychia lemnae]|uniref:Uncharacterized protein n=1 Tax=Stylonychia lemnae TaxID=5949 RepID=A0A078AQ63_STYLE|nr:UNKNOWN [Stylonychia lemnae]|eukprot:CDW83088.1 UNKNOWN [Stylonychia lemnae]
MKLRINNCMLVISLMALLSTFIAGKMFGPDCRVRHVTMRYCLMDDDCEYKDEQCVNIAYDGRRFCTLKPEIYQQFGYVCGEQVTSQILCTEVPCGRGNTCYMGHCHPPVQLYTFLN